MSGQNTLLVIAEDAQVKRPSHKYNWQVYRDTAVAGSGTYKAMDENGNIEIIGGPGAGLAVRANNYFVDSEWGNDATALPNSLNRKYATINAAATAAAAEFALTAERQVVFVFSGLYSEDANMFRNGVDYYLQPDVFIDHSGIAFNGTVAGQSSNVYGSGNIFAALGVITMTRGSIYMEAQDLTHTSSGSLFGGGVIVSRGNSQIIVKARNILGISQRAIHMLDSDQTCTLVVDANLIDSTTPGGGIPGGETIRMATTVSPYNGKAIIRANRINSSTTAATRVLRVDNVADLAVAELTIEAERIVYMGGAYVNSDVVPVGTINNDGSGNTIIRVKGNISCNTAASPGIASTDGMFAAGGNAQLVFEGEIDSLDEPAIWTGSFVYGVGGLEMYIKSRNIVSSDATNTVRLNSGPKFNIIEGRIRNTNAAGIGVNKVDAGSVSNIVFDDCKIVTAGGASVSGAALSTYKVIWVLAKNTAAAVIVNSIVGSIDYTDPGVE